MPHIEGFGSVDWDFEGSGPRENLVDLRPDPDKPMVTTSYPPYINWKFVPDHLGLYAFSYYPPQPWRDGYTVVRLKFVPDRPCVGAKGQLRSLGPLCPELDKHLPDGLARFRKLLKFTEGHHFDRTIYFRREDDWYGVSFEFPGRVNSPEGLMRGIVRRLRHTD